MCDELRLSPVVRLDARDKRTYHEYMRSPEWNDKRRKALQASGFKCCHVSVRGVPCPMREALTVHHLSYDRFGAEEDADLTVLCALHHAALHAHADVTCPTCRRRLYASIDDVADVLADVVSGDALSDAKHPMWRPATVLSLVKSAIADACEWCDGRGDKGHRPKHAAPAMVRACHLGNWVCKRQRRKREL